MQRFLYTEKRDIKMQWKYVVLQYLVLGPGLEPQVLVNITGYSAAPSTFRKRRYINQFNLKKLARVNGKNS